MDMPSLLDAIRKALQVNIDRELIRIESLGVYDHGMAACILKFAAQGTDLQVLDLALEWGRQEEVAGEEMAYAHRRRAVLHQADCGDRNLAEAAAGLATAWRSGDIEALTTSIETARIAGVSPEMLRLATRRREALERRAARAQGDADDTIAKESAAAAPSVDLALLENVNQAAEKQHLCKEAAAALKAAMRKGIAQGIKDAIEQAEHAGVSRELVAPARRKLTRLLKEE